MSFEVQHGFVFERIAPKLRRSGDEAFFEVDEEGEFTVLFPGRLRRGAAATFNHRFRSDDSPETVGDEPQGGTAPLHGGFENVQKKIPLSLRIFTPDGREFTASEITIADLRRFRDPRGGPTGPWSFRLTGKSEIVFMDEDSRLNNVRGTVHIGVIETVPSESAPPLVNTAVTRSRQTFPFDLFRIGTFVAEISRGPLGAQWRGTMRLIDPNGKAVAQTSRTKLSFKIDLPTLNKSRDAAGNVRQWTLEVTSLGAVSGKPRFHATVIGSGRITIAALEQRIDALLGERGAFIKIFGEDKGGEALARLVITDIASAETIDMHDLLEGVLRKTAQDSPAKADDVNANTIYTLGRKSDDQKLRTKLKVGSLKVDTIDAVIGPGVKLGASVPAIRLTVAVSGKAKIKFRAATVADVEVPGGKIEIEIGIALSSDGTPQIVTSVPDTLFDGDINTVAAGILAASLSTATVIGVVGSVMSAATVGEKIDNIIEEDFNDPLVKSIREAFADPSLAPRILMMIFGAHLSYKPIRFEGGDIVFDYIAPLEPEPKPSPGYQGAIGRSFTQLGPNAVSFTPVQLGDTWKADNLAKIEHVVVVIMENRSYDHVLGYRTQLGDEANGLSLKMIEAIENSHPNGNEPFSVIRLSEAQFAANTLDLKTRFPTDVGHDTKDVVEQLRFQADGPEGKGKINSPLGFVRNFRPRLRQPAGETDHNVLASDVLGYYDQLDLPFFAFLAENYAYSDRYYCSHPGPTLPNRMFSLTGDLQHDRYGFPILDNNLGDDFLLSRAPTIFDLLLRNEIEFRVYESGPSATLLRMFARYATDTTNIVPIEQLAVDVANGKLPAFSVIEPSLHHHPQNDDHPPADMHRGQFFLRNEVYKVLTSNPKLWEKTLLIITYDEHGGFYDHAIPPVADLFPIGDGPVQNPNTGGPVGTQPVGGASPTQGTFTRPLGDVMPGIGNVPVASADPQASPAPPPPPQPSLLQVRYGVRVPTFVVSPWTPPGKGPSLTLDHCSILKTVLARFLGNEKPFLSDRVSASHSFDVFLSEATPRMDVPQPPTLTELPLEDRKPLSRSTKIITEPLSRKAMREGPVDYHQLSGRWARQLGR